MSFANCFRSVSYDNILLCSVGKSSNICYTAIDKMEYLCYIS